MFKTRQLSLLLITFVAWLGATASPNAATFDLSSDFPTNSNPGGVWTFGWKTNVTEGVVPFTLIQPSTSPFFTWARFANDASAVQKNVSAQSVNLGPGEGLILPGEVLLYPGNDGRDDNFGAIRFTAPSNGLYSIVCRVTDYINGPASGDADFHVVRSGTELFSAQIPASGLTVTNGSGYTNSLTLAAGETVDFLAGRGLDAHLAGSTLKIKLTITASPSLLNCTAPPASLAVWWKGESNVVDTINGNNGTGLNGLSWTNGQVGKAFWFDGVDDYITVPASSSLDVGGGSGLTVELWIKPDQINSAMPMVEWTTPAAPGVHFWIDAGVGTRGLYSNLRDTNGVDHTLASPGNILTTGVFQHVALTYDKASGAGKIYLNGTVVASNNFGTFVPQTSYGLNLGKRTAATTGSGTLYKGLMDEISLYNTALSPSQIQDIFNAASAGKCPAVPVIISPPAPQIVKLGSNAVFVVLAGGQQPLRYQWLFNESAILNATNATLTFTASSTNLAGQYRVVITNAPGAITSSIATLFVREPLLFSSGNPPTISNGQFQFTILNVFGVGQVVVETSTNLTIWTPISTNTPVGDHLDLNDVILPNSPKRFYRVKEQ